MGENMVLESRLVNNDVDISHRTIVIGNMASSLTRKSSNRVNNIFSDKKSTKKKATFALEANEALIHVNNASEDGNNVSDDFRQLSLQGFAHLPDDCSTRVVSSDGLLPNRQEFNSSHKQEASNGNIASGNSVVHKKKGLIRTMGSKLNVILAVVILVQIIGIGMLLAEKYNLIQSHSSFAEIHEKDESESYSKFVMKPRCFSMCESPDIFYRDDKLIKTVVTYNNMKIGKYQSKPVRHYMFLFPDPPLYTASQVNKPLFLTPFINSGDIQQAKNLALVRNLENFDSIESYSGYITINATYNSNIFFWYFPAMSGNASAPVILWLQGGPGSTGLFGLLKENGPFLVDVDMDGLPFSKLNPYSWNKNYSVIYVDSPVGTGFSFTDDLKGYPRFVENSTQDLYNFLQQFYQLFPEQQPNDFYAFGESYGGKYAPQLALKIHQENQQLDGNKIKINLEGVGIGNGWMSPADQGRYASYLFYHGLLDKNQFDKLNRIDDTIVYLIENNQWDDAWKSSDEQLDFILTSLNYSNLYDMTKDQYRPSTMNFWFWIEQPEVRRAIHVGNNTFSDGLNIYMAMVGDTMRSIKPTLQEVLKHYKVLAYHGSLDIICHYPGAETMFRKTAWPGQEEFISSNREAWWAYNQDTGSYELAGYYKRGGNLRLALVRNAGHSVPLNQPQWSLRLVEDFINNKI